MLWPQAENTYCSRATYDTAWLVAWATVEDITVSTDSGPPSASAICAAIARCIGYVGCNEFSHRYWLSGIPQLGSKRSILMAYPYASQLSVVFLIWAVCGKEVGSSRTCSNRWWRSKWKTEISLYVLLTLFASFCKRMFHCCTTGFLDSSPDGARSIGGRLMNKKLRAPFW